MGLKWGLDGSQFREEGRFLGLKEISLFKQFMWSWIWKISKLILPNLWLYIEDWYQGLMTKGKWDSGHIEILLKVIKPKGFLLKHISNRIFLEAIIQDYCSSILFLDTIPNESSLPSLCTMILDIKSIQFPKISLFYLVDHM